MGIKINYFLKFVWNTLIELTIVLDIAHKWFSFFLFPHFWFFTDSTKWKEIVRRKKKFLAGSMLILSFKLWCAQSLSHVWLFETLWSIAWQAPLSMEFFRQEYWNGLLFSTTRDPSDPGIEPVSPAFPALAGRYLTTEPPGKSKLCINTYMILLVIWKFLFINLMKTTGLFLL